MTTRRRTAPSLLVLRAVSHLVPRERRRLWLAEWRAEVEHAWRVGRSGEVVPRVLLRARLTLRALASIMDALWLRGRRQGGGAWRRTIRDASRSLRRRPGFTLAVVGTLALGLGASTAIFSVLDGLMLRPLPFKDPDRLVSLYGFGSGNSMDPEMVAELRRRTDVFEDLRVNSFRSVILTGAGAARAVHAATMEPGFLKMLGIRPTLGRGLGPADAEAANDHVVLLSDELWRRAFDADPRVLGRSVELDDEPYTVIGVLPPALHRLPTAIVQAVLPLTMGQQRRSRTGQGVLAIGRLRSGLTVTTARQRIAAMAKALDREQPRDGGWEVQLRPVDRFLNGNTVHGLRALGGAVLCLLLIACANAAGLLILRGVSRRDEMGLRLALGSSRAALSAQVLVESLFMAVAAGAAGTLFAWLGVRALVALLPPDLLEFGYTKVGLDGRVLVFALGLTVVTGLAFGSLPAFRAGVAPTIRSGVTTTASKRDVRLRSLMQIAQLALVVVLLWGTGVFVRSFARIVSIPVGWDADHLVHLWMAWPGQSAEDRAVAVESGAILDERLRALPGVTGLARAARGVAWDTLAAEDRTARLFTMFPLVSVDTAYFHVMGIPVIRGRGFRTNDLLDSAHVAVVSTALARKLWPGADPVGRRFRRGQEPWLTVVGVVADAKLDGPRDPYGPLRYFLPARDERLSGPDVWIRTRQDPEGMLRSVRSIVHDVVPARPIQILETGRQMLSGDIRDARLLVDVVTAFALLAVLLAVVGLYGLVSFTVAQRRREIGVRIALGARPGNLVGSILGQGLMLAMAGVVIGLGAAALLSRFVSTLLFGVSPVDPVTFVAASVALLAGCGVALVAPARNAVLVDPSEALRAE